MIGLLRCPRQAIGPGPYAGLQLGRMPSSVDQAAAAVAPTHDEAAILLDIVEAIACTVIPAECCWKWRRRSLPAVILGGSWGWTCQQLRAHGFPRHPGPISVPLVRRLLRPQARRLGTGCLVRAMEVIGQALIEHARRP